ncbi:WD40-repeat-containing domain protein [Favolaschia claudopus]|uniref:WD40-repeat-containing domain protein n=1 Tax=Favolaschia claudopus TaxID=2862362 RepID=A0AAW0A9R6_9AGAR
MRNRPTQVNQNQSSSNKATQPNSTSQHGLLLLHIPPESLTHITCNLDPKSLLALGTVNARLSNHIKDDHTWHRAFVYQLLGIGPETDLHDASRWDLLLRRSHLGSWKQEFICYYALRRRWEKSRNTTTAHIPLHSPVSSMHLMPAHGIISSSLHYGVVSRSLPLTGRILRGYLDAAGSGTGLGIGNPNVEFSPNVSACALGSDGGTAKIAWGFRSGGIVFTSAAKAMDAASRSAAKFSRCVVNDQHHGIVWDVVWDNANAVTAGSDGRVKIWNSKNAQCIWLSEGRADDCLKVASALSKGIVVAAMSNGEIVVWSGLAADGASEATSTSVLTIPPPQGDANHEAFSLFIDVCQSSPVLLVAYRDNPLFYRYDVDLPAGTFECFKYGDPALGAITSIAPFFTSQPNESSIVVTGTQLGCVGIYDWAARDTPHTLPTYKFEAYEDAASVTALARNAVTLVTGSAWGTTKVWDALTLEHLRTFPSPMPRKRVVVPEADDPAVRQILLGPEKEVLFVAVGDRVMAWRAGPVPKGGFRTRGAVAKTKERSGTSKYHQQLEMHQAIAESRHLIKEENAHVQKAYGRAREQRAQLETLGLDEVEAVDYILMLSRDEAMERQRNVIEEGVFEGDFDEDEARVHSTVRSTSSSPESSAPFSPPLRATRTAGVRIPGKARPNARTPSNSNVKVQVSPPLRAESREASFKSSPPPLQETSPPADQFPPMSSSVSSRGSNKSTRGSPPKFAWSTPLARSPAASPRTSVASDGRISRSISSSFDDDMRLAIELSLAEAESLKSAR